MKKLQLLTTTAALLLLLAGGAAGTARAQDTNVDPEAKTERTAVDDLALADQLYLMGLEAEDPVLLIAAARIYAATPAEERDYEAVDDDESDAPQPAERADRPSLEAALEAARTHADDQPDLVAVIDEMESVAPRGRVRGPGTASGRVGAGRQVTYYGDTTRFRGGEPATITIQGYGVSDLDLFVFDENGNEICRSVRGSDRERCDWYPRWTGPFRVEVRNYGNRAADFILRTN
ncbi:MAG: hypothetical protein AAFX81_13830 [Pseudomonadota bacterium]